MYHIYHDFTYFCLINVVNKLHFTFKTPNMSSFKSLLFSELIIFFQMNNNVILKNIIIKPRLVFTYLSKKEALNDILSQLYLKNCICIQ